MQFARDNNERFNPERIPELKTACDFLMTESPNREQHDGDGIIWNGIKLRENATILEQILFLVNTVRNNLFHGGKFPHFRERDAHLLRACLIVLRECVELHSELSVYYREQLRGVQG